MIVCHCRIVSDAAIDCAIRDGATDVDAVSDATGAGSECGGCRATIADLVGQSAEKSVRIAAAC